MARETQKGTVGKHYSECLARNSTVMETLIELDMYPLAFTVIDSKKYNKIFFLERTEGNDSYLVSRQTGILVLHHSYPDPEIFDFEKVIEHAINKGWDGTSGRDLLEYEELTNVGQKTKLTVKPLPYFDLEGMAKFKSALADRETVNQMTLKAIRAEEERKEEALDPGKIIALLKPEQ